VAPVLPGSQHREAGAQRVPLKRIKGCTDAPHKGLAKSLGDVRMPKNNFNEIRGGAGNEFPNRLARTFRVLRERGYCTASLGTYRLFMDVLIGIVVVLAIGWTWVTGKWYRALRPIVVGSSESKLRRGMLVVFGSAVLAPGIVSLGHPPALYCPFAGLLAVVQLAISRGRSPGEEGFTFVFINLASWLGTMVFLAFIESKRVRSEPEAAVDPNKGAQL
jgi:hypothetical protein